MEMLEFMHFFGLDSDHPAARVFLQLAMEFMNDIELHDIALLTKIVYTMKTTKVTTLLRKGLNLMARNFFPKDIRNLEMNERVDIAYYLGKSMEGTFLRRLLRAIEEELGLLRHLHVPKIMSTLAKHDLYSDVLIDECLTKLDPHVGLQTPDELNQMVKALTDIKMFAPEIVGKICAEASWETTKWGNKDVYKLIRQGKIQSYADKDVCSRAEDILDEPTCTLAEKLETVSYLADCRASMFNNNDSFGNLENNLDNRTQREMTLDTMIDWGLASVILGQKVPTTVSLGLNTVTTLEDRDIGDETRLNLGDKLLVLSEHLNNPELREAASRSARSARRAESHLRGPLNYIIETIGAIHVENSFYTDAGHYVDHLVTEKGSGQKIGVMVFPAQCFMRNTGQLKGLPYLLCKSIQNEGLKVLVFNEVSWDQIGEGERIEHILRKISEVDEYQGLMMFGPDSIAVQMTYPKGKQPID